MATPASESEQDTPKKNLEQITFRFCAECSNMLYPKEDQDSHRLQYTCRTCQYTEEAQSSCVFRNILNNAAGETAGVTQDVGSDPTVSDAALLEQCFVCGRPSVSPAKGAANGVGELEVAKWVNINSIANVLRPILAEIELPPRWLNPTYLDSFTDLLSGDSYMDDCSVYDEEIEIDNTSTAPDSEPAQQNGITSH